jgi:hypothetical protein
MDWVLILTIVGTGLTVVGLIYTFMRNFKSDINDHIDTINTRMDNTSKEWKDEVRKMDQRVIETNKRMDGVYHVLLKKVE